MAGQVADGVLVLDDGALALGHTVLSLVAIVNAEWLVAGVFPVEVDQADHIKVLIELLKGGEEHVGVLGSLSIPQLHR